MEVGDNMYNKNDKEKYEQLINESPLFSLDKETEKIAFIKERTKMVEHLYNYLLSINCEKYKPYGYEVTEAAIQCIESFDSTKGEFLHYFNYVWKRKYSYIQLKEYQDNTYRGLHISGNDIRNVYKYIRYIKELGMDYDREELYLKLSQAMQLPVDKISELAKLAELRIVGDSATNEDGEEESLWNFIPNNVDIEKLFIEKEDKKEFLDKVERVFNSLQKREKPIISDILTTKLWLYLDETDKKYSFISKKVTEEWKKTGILPTQREIASEYNRHEASVSTSIKNFRKKIEKEIIKEI